MRKLKGNIWAKTVAVILTMIVGSAAVFCGIGTLCVGMSSSKEWSLDSVKEEVYWQVYDSYVSVMMQEYYASDMDAEKLSMLDGGDIRYTLVKKTLTWTMEDESKGQEPEAKVENEILYTNDPSVGEDNSLVCVSNDWGMVRAGNVDTFWEALIGGGRGICFWENNSTENQYIGYEVYMRPADTLSGDGMLAGGLRDYTRQADRLANLIHEFARTCGIWLLLTLAVTIALFVFLMRAAGHRTEDDDIHMRWLDKIPFGIYTAAVALGIVGGCAAVFGVMDVMFYNYVNYTFCVVVMIAAAAAAELFAIGYCMSIAVRVKTKTFWRYTVVFCILKPVWKLFKKCVTDPVNRFGKIARTNVPLFVKALLIFFAVGIVELILFMSAVYDDGMIAFFVVLIKMVEFPLLLHILYQMQLIKEGGKRIAAGDYSRPINTDKMLWEFKQHAENINNVGDGISLAVAERMKSEHFRTELITNVSHDIKTPLTSIINYVDLIKKEEITSETMQEYIDVLDRQSARLKKLIEDLMEASKASTGNLSVNLEVCDATVMLSQVVGEFEERAKENGLELVTEYPAPPVEIMADGRHLWRVIDNLLSNACKYGMPGTRVYITLEVFHGMVIMTFRNISKYRLNMGSEELMERFVRGDSSRNTEGSGLGLSIAQSLTALMDGNMAIQTDGDLFKVIVSFSQVVR